MNQMQAAIPPDPRALRLIEALCRTVGEVLTLANGYGLGFAHPWLASRR
jgi:hypothetical protein